MGKASRLVRFETMARDEDHRSAHRRRRGELRLDLRARRRRGRRAVGHRRVLLRARADRDRPRSRAAADRRGRARRRPPVGEAALGLLRRGVVRGHRLQRDLGDRGRALGSRRPALRRADPPPAGRPVPRLRAHVRRLPRGRGAALDGRDDGRAAGALGPGAARGGRGRLAAQPRARARLREGHPGRGLHAGAVRGAGAAGGRRPRLQRAEVRPRRADAVHAGHGLGDAVAGRDPVHGRAGGGGDRRGRRRGRRRLRLPLALPGRGRAAARARARGARADVARGPGAARERRRRWRG